MSSFRFMMEAIEFEIKRQKEIIESGKEVKQETKEVIRKAGKGGGFICMSSNSIHSGVNPKNYVAMVEAIREYGSYPLALD